MGNLKEDLAYYGLALMLHSLIVIEKLPKEEVKENVNRIIDELDREFN